MLGTEYSWCILIKWWFILVNMDHPYSNQLSWAMTYQPLSINEQPMTVDHRMNQQCWLTNEPSFTFIMLVNPMHDCPNCDCGLTVHDAEKAAGDQDLWWSTSEVVHYPRAGLSQGYQQRIHPSLLAPATGARTSWLKARADMQQLHIKVWFWVYPPHHVWKSCFGRRQNISAFFHGCVEHFSRHCLLSQGVRSRPLLSGTMEW